MSFGLIAVIVGILWVTLFKTLEGVVPKQVLVDKLQKLCVTRTVSALVEGDSNPTSIDAASSKESVDSNEALSLE